MVLTTTSKPTFLSLSLFRYFVLLLATLYSHVFMYVGLFVYSAVVFRVFNVFFRVFMFYVGLLIVRLCFMSDILIY